MKAVVKRKRPLLSAKHRRERMDFALAHKDWTVEDWKKVVWSDETKINRMGSDGRQWVWKKAGVTGWCRGQGSLEEGHLWYGAACYGKGLGMHARLMGEWMGSFMSRSCKMNFKKASLTTTKPRTTSSFSKIMTPSTPATRPETGFKTMTSMSCYGQHTLQTSIPLNTSGIT